MSKLRPLVSGLAPAVRVFRRISRDVNPRHHAFSARVYISSASTYHSLSSPTTFYYSTNSSKFPYHLSNTLAQKSQFGNLRQKSQSRNMSNNADLLINKVFDVKDKIALVTGGGSGIGLMITQTLAVNGAKVYIVGRTEEKLENVVQHHGKDIAGQIIPITADVRSKEGVEKLVKDLESKESHLDILVNNAGIAAPKTETTAETPEKLRENLLNPTSVDEWTSQYATNVVGPYLLTTGFLPLLNKATEHTYGYSGTVVNISSISGMVRISQGHFSYNASKGAAVHLNKMLATEIAKAGFKIRINSIAPGVFPSEMTTQESGDNQKSKMPKDHKGGLPSQRPGNDRDMAATILFVVGCQYLNGQTVTVDGGYLIQAGT
ncbi:unnamed protein product [Periconia digitata]|uniref:Uncharacterized protein n=1 Tax=Periconia digitata TaxID=1303443 RepID=A0A9W4XKA0_9PLEO|nr:unnamed protein product [Periconia digitata]